MIEAGVLDPSYLAPDSFNVIKVFTSGLDRIHPGDDVLTKTIYNKFRLRLPEFVLMRIDKIGVSVSLGARVLFFDLQLADFAFDIPEKRKTRNGVKKYLLKKAVEGIIPDEPIYRKKMGFDAPMAEWLKGSFGRRVERRITSSGLMKRRYFNPAYITNLFAICAGIAPISASSSGHLQSGGLVRLLDRTAAGSRRRVR
jgi:asparagine synthase (glutamine-hydrolysing)